MNSTDLMDNIHKITYNDVIYSPNWEKKGQPMREPTPLRLYGLKEEEITEMRDILRIAKERGFYQQNRFIRDGGDIRNLLKEGPNPRLTLEFAVTLYNYVMDELWKQVYDKDVELSQKIEHLYDLGMTKSDRYDMSLNKYMDDLVGGTIGYYNVPSSEQKIFIGYRFKTDKSVILRFYVQIFFDSQIKRTRFWSYFKMNDAYGQRETQGFAYYASGNVYLSGFINDELGLEFMAFRRTVDKRIRSGIVATTAITGIPVAKKCVMVEANHTDFWDKIRPELKESLVQPSLSNVNIANRMTPINLDRLHDDLLPGVDLDIVSLLCKKTQDGKVDTDKIEMVKIIDY